MAVYKRSYKPYEGSTTSDRWRFLVLTRYGFSGMFDSRLFTGAFVLSFVPFLLGFVMIYVAHSSAARAMLQIRGPNPSLAINNYFFLGFLGAHAWISFLLTTWQGPQLVASDLANNALPLILGRPISRSEYVIGKFLVIACLLSVITWVPMLILFFLNAGLEGNGWLWSHLWLGGAILLASWMWIAIVALVALAASAWLKWRVAASALMLAFFFVGPGFGAAINATLGTNWGHIFDVLYAVKLIWVGLFRVPLSTAEGLDMLGIPLWAAWCTVTATCGLSLLLLNRRLKAREVVRG
ncbi:MAG TPA: ABC-2 transporter permease [Terriglobales bacterium]|nr:ABC-2 transporter permease [Terriglobales bacterium]